MTNKQDFSVSSCNFVHSKFNVTTNYIFEEQHKNYAN
jgi:hypothetical protein